MSSKRTAWHFFFCILLRRYGPSAFEIRDEIPLSEEPPRMDYLLLRRAEDAQPAAPAQTLLALWERLPRVTIAELKSIGRPYQKGELDRLWSYTHMYRAAELDGLGRRNNLAALLLVPRRTPSLDEDVAEMSLAWVDLGGGYFRLSGGLFALFVVEIDVVAEQPDEDLLALYSHHEVRSPRATRFWGELTGAEAKMDVRNLEGYEEEIKRIMSAMPPELRLAGLPPGQLLLGLPDDYLRALPDEILARLPADTLAAIRKRLGNM